MPATPLIRARSARLVSSRISLTLHPQWSASALRWPGLAPALSSCSLSDMPFSLSLATIVSVAPLRNLICLAISTRLRLIVYGTCGLRLSEVCTGSTPATCKSINYANLDRLTAPVTKTMRHQCNERMTQQNVRKSLGSMTLSQTVSRCLKSSQVYTT